MGVASALRGSGVLIARRKLDDINYFLYLFICRRLNFYIIQAGWHQFSASLSFSHQTLAIFNSWLIYGRTPGVGQLGFFLYRFHFIHSPLPPLRHLSRPLILFPIAV
jgi:hypothetical protein